jgi:hypothetical protein
MIQSAIHVQAQISGYENDNPAIIAADSAEA